MARENLSGQYASDTATIRALYDDWAPAYDGEIEGYGYEAPAVAAQRMAGLADPSNDRLLDVGCGTGLVGKALGDLGWRHVEGADVSEASLRIASTAQTYRAVHTADFNAPPTPFDSGSLVCVGVMTYLADVEEVCREFARIVAPGSPILLTQRTDLFEARETQAAFDALAADGTWDILDISDPMPYLPGHEEYQGIDVHYCVFRSR